MVENFPAMQETQVQSLGQEDPLEEEMATHSRVLAWRFPWTEEPGRLQSMGSQRIGYNWTTRQRQQQLWALAHSEQFFFSLPRSLPKLPRWGFWDHESGAWSRAARRAALLECQESQGHLACFASAGLSASGILPCGERGFIDGPGNTEASLIQSPAEVHGGWPWGPIWCPWASPLL